MGYEKTLANNLSEILRVGTKDEIREFQQSLSNNISKSVQMMLKSTAFFLTVLSSHYLLQYGQIDSVGIGANAISDSTFLRTALLWLGSASFAAMILSDYLRRCYRETLDYMLILSKSEFTKTGLHDFAVPANYFLALDLLRDDGSQSGKAIAISLQIILQSVILAMPLAYLTIQLLKTVSNQASEYLINLAVASSAIVLILMTLIIIWKSSRLSNPLAIARNLS